MNNKMSLNELNELSKDIHNFAVAKGFYEKEIETGTALMLIVSELGEALEADRKARHANVLHVLNVTEGETFENMFELHVKDTFEDEIADTFIRLMDFVASKRIDIETHVRLKLKYNASRPKMHGKLY